MQLLCFRFTYDLFYFLLISVLTPSWVKIDYFFYGLEVELKFYSTVNKKYSMKKIGNAAFGLVFASFFVVTGCTSLSDKKVTTAVLTEADSGRTIQLKVGQNLQLKLNENRSTGYHWQQTNMSSENLLLAVGQPSYSQNNVATPVGANGVPLVVVGAPGMLTTNYIAEKVGKQNLEWVQLPPGSGRPPVKVLNFQIVIE